MTDCDKLSIGIMRQEYFLCIRFGDDDNPNNIRRETGRHFRNKKRKYLKDKIYEHAANSKNKNIRDLYRGIN
jgi:hypothetical protein